MTCEISCATFTITGDSYTVYLTKPIWAGEDDKIIKDIDKKSFWSGNYEVDDKGIRSQPLVLRGIEATCTFDSDFTDKMQQMIEMSNDNEEVTISGLDTYMDGVYVIRGFAFNTIKRVVNAYAWTLTLEKVRD